MYKPVTLQAKLIFRWVYQWGYLGQCIHRLTCHDVSSCVPPPNVDGLGKKLHIIRISNVSCAVYISYYYAFTYTFGHFPTTAYFISIKRHIFLSLSLKRKLEARRVVNIESCEQINNGDKGRPTGNWAGNSGGRLGNGLGRNSSPG